MNGITLAFIIQVSKERAWHMQQLKNLAFGPLFLIWFDPLFLVLFLFFKFKKKIKKTLYLFLKI